MKSKADAYPQSSLLVDDDTVSKGPSTGPPYSNNVVLFVVMTHPKVPCCPSRPPSDAIVSLSRERKARQTWRSEAICLTSESKRRCVRGRLLVYSLTVGKLIGSGVSDVRDCGALGSAL